MSRPACEDCAQPADYTVIDHGGGWANRGKGGPFLPICRPCLDQRRADEADDPWPLWADPKILTDWTTKEHAMTLEQQLAPIAAELADLADRRRQIEDREKELREQIEALVDGPDKYQAGNLTVVVSANRRFDASLAEKILPAELYDAIKIAKPDSAAAREVLPPALYEQCMSTVGKHRISVR